MKKSAIIILALIILISLFGCGVKREDITDVKIATLAGPTGMGMIELIDNQDDIYEVTIYITPDQITSKIINGEVDIAAIPSNLAAVLYTKTQGAISIVSVNTLGVLYIIEIGDTINSIDDLKGTTLYATGQGATPEYVINDIFEKNDMAADVDIQFMSVHSDLANQMAAGDIKLGLLPEPFVSMVLAKNPDTRIAVSLNDEYKAIYGNDSSIPMTATIVRNEFAEKYPKELKKVFKAYEDSINYVNNNIKEASKKMVTHGIIANEAIAESAIPNCEISYIAGNKSIDMLNNYFQVLFDSNPASIGGKMVDERIYYKD